MRYFRIFTGIFVALLLISTAWAEEAKPAQPVADPDPARFAESFNIFAKFDRGNTWIKDAILFVGSSSIVYWSTREAFPEYPIINRGFGGSHISDVNHYLEQAVLKYQPKLIVFYAGDNDINDQKAPERVFDDYQTFVNQVRTKLGDIKILYLPIKPSIDRWAVWPQMQAANQLIQAYVDQDDNQHYVDVATPMLMDNGEVMQDIFVEDGLHLNEKGYEIWNGVMKPALAKWYQPATP